MELRAGEATVEKLKSRFEVLAKGDGEVLYCRVIVRAIDTMTNFVIKR